MRSECIKAVGAALGRTPNQGETRDIENRVRMARRAIAREDPVKWQGLSSADQTSQAGARAAAEITREAALKRHRTAVAILAHDKMQAYIDSQIAAGHDEDGVAALGRMLQGRPDGKDNIVSVQSLVNGIESVAQTRLTRSWDVAGGKFLHLLRDPKAEATLVRALHGDANAPKEFRDAAKDFHEIAERLRTRFNAAGGDVGKLENWGMPHSWSRSRLLDATRAEWGKVMMPLMDRAKYVHEDGKAFTDNEMRAFLDEAYTSIVTDGANKDANDSGPPSGIKANRNSAGRSVHLSGPEAYLTAMNSFSDSGVMAAMMGHVSRMARDIALVEQFGPNADRQFAQFLDRETRKAITAKPDRQSIIQGRSNYNERFYNYLAGNGAPPPDSWHGKALQVWRDLNVLKLGSAIISSVGDYSTIHLTAHVNGIPHMKLFLNELSALNPTNAAEKRMGESAGLMVRAYAQDISRFGGDVGQHGWSSKLANTFMKVTMLPYVTEARRRAFSYGMMNQVGQALRDSDTVAGLNDADQRFLKRSGITEADWQVLRLAEPDKFGGNNTLVTPESVYKIPDAKIAALTAERPQIVKDRAASRLMAFVLAEQDRAVIEPTPRTRVFLGADKPAEGLTGYLSRSFALFKSFSAEVTYQHLGRALGAFETKRGSAGYLAAMIASATVLGAVANTIKDLVAGRDPRTLNPSSKDGYKNWVAALVTGGGLGMYGDFLINTYGSRGNTIAETVAGPLVADASVVLGTAQQAVAASSDPNAKALQELQPAGAKLVNTLKSYVPGSSLWYTKAAMDRMIWNELSDYFSPGYMARMKSKARQQHRTNWWEPDQAVPSRAPNLSTIAE